MKINNTQFELKYSFKAINELLKETGSTMDKVGQLAEDLNNIPLIAHIGNKYAGGSLTKEDFENLLDEGTFEDALSIVREFGAQVGKYFDPNGKSQAPLMN